MPEIRPFKGLLYNPEKIQDLARVVTAPYDVISSAEQRAYYKLEPYNIIRLILGKRYPQDDAKHNQYTRAKRCLSDWQAQGILLPDQKKAFYIYAQSFLHNHKRQVRTGFIVLLKLEDFAKNTVLPHEDTFFQAVQDRLRLLTATRTNLSPIFALFSDPQSKVSQVLSVYKKAHRPYIVVKKDQVTHCIWRMNAQAKIRAIQKLLKDKQIFIADGHHRYQAALNFKHKMQRKEVGNGRTPGFNYLMTYLVASNAPGLAILPTHRAVRIKGRFNRAKVIASLKSAFRVRRFACREDLFDYLSKVPRKTSVFGLYLGQGKFYGLQSKTAAQNLDVHILHNLIINQILNFVNFSPNICYTRDAQEAVALVNRNQCQLAFFLRPTKVSQVKRVASKGERMPHKSTYFYPKLLTGLVLYKF